MKRGLVVPLLLSLALLARAETLVLQPGPEDGVDVWITSYYSYGSNGGVDDFRLQVGGWGDHYYSLIRFQNDSLPKNITSAKLQLYCWGHKEEGGGKPVAMDLFLVQSKWDEKTNWKNRPNIVWFESLPAAVKNNWYEIDVTILCQSWVNGQIPNYGIQLGACSVSNAWNEFFSSDTNDPSLRPRLVIECERPKLIPPVEPWGPSIPDDPECLFGGNWPSCPTKESCDKQFGPRPFLHCGFDAKAPAGTEVIASADGVVVIKRDDIGGGWAGVVVIEHDTDGNSATTEDRLTTLYLHINPLVEEGDVLKQGDLLGHTAWLTTGAHLHFGARSGAFNKREKIDTYYRGALPPPGTNGNCRSCSGKSSPLPTFPEQWIDPVSLF